MKRSGLFWSFLFFILFVPGIALAETVSLPVVIEYPLLRSIIVQSFFTGAETTLVALDQDNGCRKVVLSEPSFKPDDGTIKTRVAVSVKFGAYFMGRCIGTLKWKGVVEARQKLRIEPATWAIRFTTIDSALYDRNGQPATLTGIVWSVVKRSVHSRLDTLETPLGNILIEMESIMPAMFPDERKHIAEKLMASLRPGEVFTEDSCVKTSILADIPDLPAPDQKQDLESTSFTEEEIDRLTKVWETWDAYLTHEITTLSTNLLNEDDRQELLDLLLETRIRFVTALDNGLLDADFLRRQFVDGWMVLSPIIRTELLTRPEGKNPIDLFSFFFMSDTIVTLEAYSERLGLNFTRSGLFRLAQLMEGGEPVDLSYASGENSDLRKAIGIEEAGDEVTDPPEPGTIDKQKGKPDMEGRLEMFPLLFGGLIWRIAFSDVPENKPALPDVSEWLFKKHDVMSYIKKTGKLIEDSAEVVVSKGKLPAKYNPLYKTIVTATAWQESCFRQFSVKKGKAGPLVSYNNSSVGIMQIHLRVWRGIYDAQKLQWDIHYNANAGAEIAELYLRRYALRKMKKLKNPIDNDTLARSVYAMYNGGPGQFYKFVKRAKNKKFYLSDKLFAEKYEWTKAQEFYKTKKCLVGG